MSIIIHNKKFHHYPLEIFSRKSAISNCINKNCYKYTKLQVDVDFLVVQWN